MAVFTSRRHAQQRKHRTPHQWTQLINSALQRHPATVVVDLSGLNFTDCAGLSVLVWAHKRLAGRGQQLVIAGATPIVQRLLRLTELDAYLHLSPADTPNDNPDERTHA